MIEEFVRQFSQSNPFDDNRVTTVDGLRGDVREINERAFVSLQGHAEKATTASKGRGVLVTGSPGIGKSHLLARFGQWARTEKYPFIYLLNLQAGPEDLLRSILRATVGVLAHEYSASPSRSRLYRLISSGVKKALRTRSEGVNAQAENRQWSRGDARRALTGMLRDQQVRSSIIAALWTIFDVVQCRRMKLRTDLTAASLAICWLSGDILDAEEAKRFGIRTHPVSEEGFALTLEEMKEVLRTLCLLAAARERSLILCFDQVDTLSEDQVQSWSATVHALLDLCPGLMVVTSGVDETFLRWTSRGLISKASWDDRIRQFPVLLSGISAAHARQMIQCRLNEWFRPLDLNDDILRARQSDVFFPITTVDIDAALRDSDGTDRHDLRPRDIISRAGAAWERQLQLFHRIGPDAWLQKWQHGTTRGSGIDSVDTTAVQSHPPDVTDSDPHAQATASIERRLREHIDLRLAQKESLSIDPSQVSGLIRNAVAACLKSDGSVRTSLYQTLANQVIPGALTRPKPTFGLIVEHMIPLREKRFRIGVAVCDVVSGNAATHLMKRLKTELFDSPSVDRIVLIVDDRRPLDLAKTGLALFDFLERQGQNFRLIRSTLEMFAALDAMEAIAGQARSGDLTFRNSHGHLVEISESDVRHWYHQSRRYLDSPILREILTLSPLEQDPSLLADDSGISLDVIDSSDGTAEEPEHSDTPWKKGPRPLTK